MGFNHKDFQYGIQKQKEILDTLKEYFNETVKEYTETFSKYDFYDDQGHLYELKSRRIKKNQYQTTIVPCDKVLNNNLYFLFLFEDELCYIQYNKEKFNLYEKKPFQRSDYYVEKYYYYIPIDDLTTIKKQ